MGLDSLESVIFFIFAVLLSLSMHEFAHAAAANAMGDPTPRLLGRLTLNPLAHLDFLGTLALVITQRVGWAKPVPINPANFHSSRKGLVLVSLAGPLANLTLCVLASIAIRLGLPYAWGGQVLLDFLYVNFSINLGLALFNLIPVPPLDGSKVLMGLLPPRLGYKLEQLEAYGPFLLLLLLMIPGAVRAIIGPFYSLFAGLLLGTAW